MAFEHLNQVLAERKQQGLLRQRKNASSVCGREICVDGRQLLDFSSNDYLGMQHNSQVKQAWIAGVGKYGNGSGASPLVTGFSPAHHELETYLAKSLNREAVLLFNSGFSANQALCQALLSNGDTIVADKLSHASLIDGALSCNGKLLRFRHNDLEHAETQLCKASGNTLLVTEGIFSMDGDSAPLQQLSELACKYNAWLMVDDAHGFGWLGDSGLGSVEVHGLSQDELPVYMATFGKAIGTAGAFIAGSQALIDFLVNHARHYIYSTAMPASQAFATLASVKQIQSDSESRQRLKDNIAWFKACAVEQGLRVLPSDSPIQPVICGGNEQAVEASTSLNNKGFCVVAIRPPTVPKGTSRLRVTLSAQHTQQDISALVSSIARSLS